MAPPPPISFSRLGWQWSILALTGDWTDIVVSGVNMRTLRTTGGEDGGWPQFGPWGLLGDGRSVSAVWTRQWSPYHRAETCWLSPQRWNILQQSRKTGPIMVNKVETWIMNLNIVDILLNTFHQEHVLCWLWIVFKPETWEEYLCSYVMLFVRNNAEVGNQWKYLNKYWAVSVTTSNNMYSCY